MQSKKLAKKTVRASTQKYLDIAEIKSGTVVMKDGTLRAVLLVGSINFALKSEDEQNALISSYVSFLNALEYPLQVVIQSRKMNIEGYMNRLSEKEKTQENELLRMQIADYRSFVGELVDLGEIMSKRFFVVVPFDPLSNKRKGFFQRLKEVLTPVSTLALKEERFQKRKADLDMRVRQVQSGLGSMSLEIARLDTQGLIELYYNIYNPDTFMSEKIVQTRKLRVEQ